MDWSTVILNELGVEDTILLVHHMDVNVTTYIATAAEGGACRIMFSLSGASNRNNKSIRSSFLLSILIRFLNKSRAFNIAC